MAPRKITAWLAGVFASEAVIWLAVTLAAAVGAAWSNWAGLSWPWTLLVVVVCATQSVVLLCNVSEWRDRNRVAGRLTFDSGRIMLDVDLNGDVYATRLGLTVRNHAPFNLQFQVTEIMTAFNGRVPMGITSPVEQTFEAPADGLGWFDYAPIECSPPRAQTLVGELQATLKYGRVGRLKHELRVHRVVHASFDDNGKLINAIWYDIA